MCFPVTFAEFLRTLILIKICEQLLLPFLLFTVDVSSQGLVSALNSIGLLQGAQWCAPLLFEKKRKISQNGHSLSLVATRCYSLYHSLSLAVPLVVIRCHLLPFVVIPCTTSRRLLSLDVPLVCLFINDPRIVVKFLEITSNCPMQKSSRWQMFFKIGVLKNFAIFTGKNLHSSLFLIKLQP